MDDILMKAREYWVFVAARADGHERSAEWHRHRGMLLGVTATTLSAVVSTAVFTTLASQLGLSKNGSIPIPHNVWAVLILIVVTLLLILSPVMTGVQSYLNHPEQANKHRAFWAGYYGLQQRIDLFLLRYASANGTHRQEALKELGEISRGIEELSKNVSITLTPDVLAEAKAKVQQQMTALPQGPTPVQPPSNSRVK